MRMKLFPILFLSASVAAGAQSFTLSYNHHTTENLFQTSAPVSDQISSFSLFVGRDSAGLSLLAQADIAYFHRNPELSFGSLNAGLDILKPSGEKSAFYFAAGMSGSLFRSDYSAFSSLSFDLLGAFKSYLAPTSILKIQWRGDYWKYRDPLFDFFSQVSSLSLDKYFQTRTTVKAEASWKFKYFLHPYLNAPPEPLPELLGSQMGGGRGGSQYRGGSGFIPIYRTGGGGAGIHNASLALLLAQGLGDRLGLSFSGLRQWNLSGQNPFLSIEEFYFVRNPSADDFSWKGWAGSSLLTFVIPGDIELKIGYNYTDKAFPGIEVLSSEGEPTGIPRTDQRHLVEGRIEKDFPRFTVFLAYSHIDNRSNDPLFAWRSPSFMGGIEWTIPAGRKE
jgi:hypothetical protein